MTRTLVTKKRITILVVFVLLLAGALAIIRIYNPDVGFTYFEPAYLPPNVSIKAKRISTFKNYSELTQVEQNFRTEDWVYGIREAREDIFSGIGTASQDYDPTSVKPTCNLSTTPAGMQYRLCHWIDYGRINVHEVIFIKDGTRVYSQIPTETSQDVSIEDIEKYVDSFEQKSTLWFPVLHSIGA